MRRLLLAAAVAAACALPGAARADGGQVPHVLLSDFTRGAASASVVDALAAADARRDPDRPHLEATAADRARARHLLAEAARLDDRR